MSDTLFADPGTAAMPLSDETLVAIHRLLVAQKYSEDQPREPAGSPEGGRFAGGDARYTTEGGDRLRPILDPQAPPRARSGPIVDHHRAALPFKTDDPTRVANLPEKHIAKVWGVITSPKLVTKEFLKDGKPNPDFGKPMGFPGMTAEKMQENLRGVITRGLADPETAAAGKAWYGSARDFAQGLADRHGYSLQQAVGIIAAMSPQQDWGGNAATADYLGRILKEDPVVHLNEQGLIDATGELAKKGIGVDGMEGVRLSDVVRDGEPEDLLRAAAAIKAMGKADDVGFINDLTGKREGARWSCGLAGIAVAVGVARGGTPDDELGGHKVRSFYNNILLGSTGDVTIDTHAISAAVGEKVYGQDPRTGAIMGGPRLTEYGTKGAYPVLADAYRTVAAEFGLPPEQAQAIIWLQWRKEHPWWT